MIDQCTTHRVKRGLFDGIGIGMKKLFGVITEGDIQKLQNEINAIENGLSNYTQGFVSILDTLYSLERHTDDCVDNIKLGLEYSSRMINSTAANLMRLEAYANESRSQISIIQNEIKSKRYSNLRFTMSVTHGHNLDSLRSLTKSQLQASSELMYGRIPVMLITPEMIS